MLCLNVYASMHHWWKSTRLTHERARVTEGQRVCYVATVLDVSHGALLEQAESLETAAEMRFREQCQ